MSECERIINGFIQSIMFLSPGADYVHVVGRAGSGEPSVLGFVDARGAAGVFSVLRQKTL